jgi:methyl-accepting chemotaxis protein
MKLRTKILLGFIALVVVFAIAIVISLLALETAAAGFEEYRGLARDTNLSGRLQANMLMVRMNVKDFIITHSDTDIQQYDDYYELMSTFLAEAQSSIENPDRAKLVDEADEKVQEYDSYFDQLKEHAAEVDRGVAEVLDVIGPKIEQNLTRIINSAQTDGDTVAAANAAQALRSLLLGRIYVIKFLKDNLPADATRVESEFADLDRYLQILDEELQSPERRALLAEVHGLDDEYLSEFRLISQEIYDLNDIVQNNLDVLGPQIADDVENVKLSVMADQDELGPRLEASNNNAIIQIFIITGIAIILAGVIIVITSSSVIKQLGADPGIIDQIMKKVALGDLDVTAADYGITSIRGVFDAVMNMLAALQDKATMVEQVANGDLSVDVSLASDNDSLGLSLTKMKESLNELLGQVNTAVVQVNTGAEQISQSSQALSQGAAEQASSLEEVTSAITEVNSQSKLNAESANEAHNLAREASDNATSGRSQMDELNQIMERINVSSDEINRVVKIIDDIAFQINLLALNANVEAARAGKYGKGFAVVAEEVRNLAVRSAEAVKETTQMVNDTVENIKAGNQAAEVTATQLVSIVDGTAKVADLLSEIASASNEQAQAIDQINAGLEQIDQATQGNTAIAEESAAASEELAGQAQQLQGMVAQFKLDNSMSGDMRYLPPGED